MSNSDSSCSESGSDSGSEGANIVEKTTQNVSDYEKTRLKRMAENKARMEAMGLHKMANSLMGSGQIKEKNRKMEAKGKKKVIDEDEDYKPDVGSETEEEEDDDDDSVSGASSETKFNKAKKKSSTTSKKIANKNISSNSNFEDDHDLMQAIALSLQDSAGFLDVVDHGHSRSSYTHPKYGEADKEKESSPNKEDSGGRKRKKQASNRVQITEDELILHFFQFDEAGQASITLRDLRRVAADHDFEWSDKEIEDMIHVFDSDGDGKLSLEDFRTIVGRCQMMQPVVDSKSY